MDATDLSATLQNLTSMFHSSIEKTLHLYTVSSVPGAQLRTVKGLSADYLQFKIFVLKAANILMKELKLLNTGMETRSMRKVLLLHGIPEEFKKNVVQ